MNLYGLLVVQDEGDIIEGTLEFLRKINIYETIFFFDLGSEDDTFEKAKKFQDILYKPQVFNEVYTEKLRFDLLAKHKSFYKEGDWVAIIDADEFYVDNPIDLIKIAEHENACSIRTYQAEFMFTDIDLKDCEKEDLTLPIYERRKYYLIDWSEERFYKFLPTNGLFNSSRPCSRRLLNKHYQYRTPLQIKKRIKKRLENKTKTKNLPGKQEWRHIFSDNWEDYIVPHKILHEHTGGEFKFGLPAGVQWKDYYSKNPFSTVFPQIATFFMKEKMALEAVPFSQNEHINSKKKKEKVYTIKRLIFQDSYIAQIIKEVWESVKIRQWKEAVRGLLVLFRYYPRKLMWAGFIWINYIAFRFKDIVWNITVSLKRRALRKSIGSITAFPNPIIVPYLEWAGATTLSWSSGGTTDVEVHVDTPDGPLFSRKGPKGERTTGKWVIDRMVFYLQDVSGKKPLTYENTLARTTIKVITKAYVDSCER